VLSVCEASRCLRMRGVAPHVSEPVLRAECDRQLAAVEHVVFTTRDEALVTFCSIRSRPPPGGGGGLQWSWPPCSCGSMLSCCCSLREQAPSIWGFGASPRVFSP
jgi:hypothetical protein